MNRAKSLKSAEFRSIVISYISRYSRISLSGISNNSSAFSSFWWLWKMLWEKLVSSPKFMFDSCRFQFCIILNDLFIVLNLAYSTANVTSSTPISEISFLLTKPSNSAEANSKFLFMFFILPTLSFNVDEGTRPIGAYTLFFWRRQRHPRSESWSWMGQRSALLRVP